MALLKRKIDDFLAQWKNNPNKMPLIVKGARQIGKTESIRNFARNNYKHIIEINFVLQKQFKDIFDDGFEVDTIIRNISLRRPDFEFVAGETLIFFDELQDCMNCATSLKSFRLDGRYDVICSGSLMGINYNEIESNSVGNKEDYEMYSMDFEEFLWAKGYKQEQIEDLFWHMKTLTPFSEVELEVMFDNFREYMVLGGMPMIVNSFVTNKNYSGTLKMQRQILLDYEEDITKYAGGLDKGKILNVYRKIPVFLGKDNKKFQISKVAKDARSREYAGTVDWLSDAGIVNLCYCMALPELPLKGNYNPENFKIYFSDTGLLIGALDEEAQEDLRNNKNFNALIFRRDYNQVTSPGGLWDSSKKIYSYVKGCYPLKTPKLHWTFPSGASVNFAHLGSDEDCLSWQGSQITMLGFDELTHFSEYQFFYMLSRNRTDSGISPYIRATCNPDADS